MLDYYHTKRLLASKKGGFISIVAAFFILVSVQTEALSLDKPVERGERPPIDLVNVPEDAYEEGVIRIKFDESKTSTLSETEMSRKEDGTLTLGLSGVDALNAKYNVHNARKTFASAALNNKYSERHKKWGFHLWYDLRVDAKTDIIAMVQDYMALEEVEHAEPHYKKELIGNVPNEDESTESGNASDSDTPKLEGWFPDDDDFEDQWHYHNTGQTNGTPGADISLPEAWSIETGNPDVIIAVVDGGIEITHPDLEDNIWEDVGYNFVSDSETILPHNHGSHVAGTIGAATNNDLGVSGIAGGWDNLPGVSLMSAQVFEPGFFGPSGGFEIAPIYAADNGAAISQNSWGYTSAGYYEQAVLDAIDYFNTHGGGDVMDGGLTIFAAGNDGNDADNYPGYYSGAMAVAATNHDDELAWYSNYGDHVELSAPGGETNNITTEGVLSSVNTGYDFYQGTSMACPHVTGVVALMLSMAPGEFDADQIADMLLSTTDDIEDSNPGYIGQLGSGRLNAYAALQETLFHMADPDAPAAPADFTVIADDEGELEAGLTWTNPVETASGETLTELDTIHIYRGDELVHSILDPVIGESDSYTDSAIDEDGSTMYIIRGANNAGEGLAASASAFVGHDVPAEPLNVHLDPAGNNAIITWEEPVEGLNGGYYDGENLSYTITRHPDETVVAEDHTESSYLDNEVPGVGNYNYEVTAHNHMGEGGTAESNYATLGAEGLLIYEPFEYDEDELPAGWTIDGSGGNNWGVYDDSTAGGEAPQMRFNWNPSFDGVSTLLTHEVDIDGAGELKLTFQNYLRNFGSGAGEISVSYTTDSGDNWEELMSFDGTDDYGPVAEEFFIYPEAGAETLQIAFQWNGDSYDIWDWNIDDVILENMGEFYEVTFEVVDEFSDPVENATITMNEKTPNEIAPGVYLFNLVDPGDHSYSIEKEGYEGHEGQIEVVDEHVTEEVELIAHRYSVTFDLRDEEDNPLDNAVVTLDSLTIENGDYVFEEILAGSYPYTVEKEGYYPVTDTVAVDLEDVTELVIMEKMIFAVSFEPVRENGHFIPDATVTLDGVENPRGDYNYEDMVPGTYDYVIERPTFFSETGSVEIVDEDINKTVTMNPDDTSTEFVDDNIVVVYPNPADNRLSVESDRQIDEISVMDIHGRVIETIYPEAEKTDIDVDHLETGMYFIRIHTSEELITRRIHIL